MKKTLIIGHRGAPHHAPENTLKSFKKALQHGVDMIELDVHLTKDKKLIVMHDPDLSRMCDIDKEIKKHTLEEIKKITIHGESIPTLEETIDLLKGKCMINIESKVRKSAVPIVRMIEKKGIIDDTVVASSSYFFLKKIKDTNPFIRTSWVMRNPSIFYILRARLLGLYAFQPHINVVTKRLVKRAHKHNLKVFVWWRIRPMFKINIKKLKKLNPDGIITNDATKEIKDYHLTSRK